MLEDDDSLVQGAGDTSRCISTLSFGRSGLVDLDDDLLPSYPLLLINDSFEPSARLSEEENMLNCRSRLKYKEASIMDTTSYQ